MGRWIMLAALIVALALVSGCKKDERGTASLSVRTTLPEGIEAALVSMDRPGTYVERAKTDMSGTFRYIRIVPGRYMLVYQFLAYDTVPYHTPYTYGQSDAFDVKAGRNAVEWSVDSGTVTPVSGK